MEEQSGLKNREIRLHITRNGQEKICYFRISVAPIIVNGRKNTLLSLIDITENIDRENLIKEDRDMNTNILNQLPSLVWMTDSNLHCTYINHVFTSYTGIALSDMTDHTFIDLILLTDTDGWILEANKSAVSAYGYTEEELCGLNIRDIRPTWTCPVSDEEKEGYQSAQGEVFLPVHEHEKSVRIL